MMNSSRLQRSRHGMAAAQHGAVLLFSLVALVIMLIAAVALVRSFNSALFTAGNIGFKRDLQNQSEAAVNKALDAFRSGALSSPGARANDLVSSNYKAMRLSTNAQGIPDALLDNSGFSTYGAVANDLTSADGSVKIRYIIDRLCASSGEETLLGESSCVLVDNDRQAGTSAANLLGAGQKPLCPTCRSAANFGVVYRLSVKVTGPRNTQSFFQSTFTVPSS